MRDLRTVGRTSSKTGFGAPGNAREATKASAFARRSSAFGDAPASSFRAWRRTARTSPVRETRTSPYGGYLSTPFRQYVTSNPKSRGPRTGSRSALRLRSGLSRSSLSRSGESPTVVTTNALSTSIPHLRASASATSRTLPRVTVKPRGSGAS